MGFFDLAGFLWARDVRKGLAWYATAAAIW